MKAHNNDPNAITRPNLLAAIRAMHNFDAGGMVPPIDVGRQIGSTCLVGMQVRTASSCASIRSSPARSIATRTRPV